MKTLVIVLIALLIINFILIESLCVRNSRRTNYTGGISFRTVEGDTYLTHVDNDGESHLYKVEFHKFGAVFIDMHNFTRSILLKKESSEQDVTSLIKPYLPARPLKTLTDLWDEN